jgi:hypothetical protein
MRLDEDERAKLRALVEGSELRPIRADEAESVESESSQQT